MQNQVLPFSLKASKFILSRSGKPFPGITARLFFRMYCTPLKRKFKKHHYAARDMSKMEKIMMTRYAFDDRRLAIAGYRWGESDRKVLLLHGWGGRALDFLSTVDKLLERGYEVRSFDFPAHGFSDGKRTTLVQWMHILEQFIQKHPAFEAIVGHSMGGMMAALTLARKDVSCKKLVMAASAVSAPAFFADTYALFNIGEEVRHRVSRLIKSRLQDDLNNFNLYNYIGKIKSDDILFAYDRNDQLVKPETIEPFLAAYGSIQKLAIKGEGHFKILKDDRILDSIDHFIRGHNQVEDSRVGQGSIG